MEENRRQNERINISLETVLESSSGKRECRISDLSIGGCFVDTIVSARIGEIVSLTIRLLAEQWLKLYGEVVYVFPGTGFGLTFTGLEEEKKRLLEPLILAHNG